MKRKFSYSMKEMNRRLLAIGRPIRNYIAISTVASVLGALSHMGLMGFGALWLLAAAGFCDGMMTYAALTVTCAVLIAVCRYLEGLFSHLGAYGILAKMRVHLFDAIDRISPAYMIGRETGDIMNIAVADIETLEYFFAHTIGPMFTVILLPLTTIALAWFVNPLYALVLIPIYIMISVVLPLGALIAGRGIGMRYREQLGDLKSKILESVYSIRDIQIFGAGNRKMNEITALDIRDWQQRVKEMGEATGLPYSETYLYTIHAQLTALFNYAQTFYGLRFNPCDAAGYMGSSVAGEMLIITKDQYELLRKEFRNEAYLLAFDILFWTGCREGEMLALLPKDLTDDDQLRIYKTYHRKKGQDIFGPTKNSKKGGNRNVPIPHWLAEEFRTYCSRLYGLTPDDRVFYMTCTALNKELTRCTQLTYLPDIRVHDLRHSHVSLCIELGYSIVLVAKRIGDTVPVVMRTYAHLYPNKQQELVSKLEAIGSPTSNNDDSDLMSLGQAENR